MAMGWSIRILIAYWIAVQAFRVSGGKYMECVILTFVFIALSWNSDILAPHGWFTLGSFFSLGDIQPERSQKMIVNAFFLGEATNLAPLIIFAIPGQIQTSWIEKVAIAIATIAFGFLSIGTVFSPGEIQFAPPMHSASLGFEVYVIDRAFPSAGTIAAYTFLGCLFYLALGKIIVSSRDSIEHSDRSPSIPLPAKEADYPTLSSGYGIGVGSGETEKSRMVSMNDIMTTLDSSFLVWSGNRHPHANELENALRIDAYWEWNAAAEFGDMRLPEFAPGPGDTSWVHIPDAGHADYEALHMQHSVGYNFDHYSGFGPIYSLRDAANIPQVTVLVADGTVVHARRRANEAVTARELEAIATLATYCGWKVAAPESL